MNPMISNKEWEILLANSFSELPKECILSRINFSKFISIKS